MFLLRSLRREETSRDGPIALTPLESLALFLIYARSSKPTPTTFEDFLAKRDFTTTFFSFPTLLICIFHLIDDFFVTTRNQFSEQGLRVICSILRDKGQFLDESPPLMTEDCSTITSKCKHELPRRYPTPNGDIYSYIGPVIHKSQPTSKSNQMICRYSELYYIELVDVQTARDKDAEPKQHDFKSVDPSYYIDNPLPIDQLHLHVSSSELKAAILAASIVLDVRTVNSTYVRYNDPRKYEVENSIIAFQRNELRHCALHGCPSTHAHGSDGPSVGDGELRVDDTEIKTEDVDVTVAFNASCDDRDILQSEIDRQLDKVVNINSPGKRKDNPGRWTKKELEAIRHYKRAVHVRKLFKELPFFLDSYSVKSRRSRKKTLFTVHLE